jgi:hypothetical protein
MGYIISLQDYAPPARSDDRPFTKARIEEAAEATGIWAAIDTLTLPAEHAGSDPEHPEVRELTTRNGTRIEGWYRVVWIDGENNESTPTAPVQNLSELAGGVRPTIASVAALLRARTKITGGKEQGTFTESTRPTANEVDNLIDEALDEVLGKIAVPKEGTPLEGRARGAIALYAAILIELSYWPEAVASGKSPLVAYEKLYASRVKALIAESETGKPQGEGGVGDAPPDCAYSFPANEGGLVGWASRW